jgi:hypothetical protein
MPVFEPNRDQMRQYFLTVWKKHQTQQALEPLEEIILDVILAHPEYHHSLHENFLDKNYLPELGETNPFLHLGLHIALYEQLSTNRPQGICSAYMELRPLYPDPHQLEHDIIDCLAESLWKAQRNNTAPDEQAYLRKVKALKKQKKTR